MHRKIVSVAVAAMMLGIVAGGARQAVALDPPSHDEIIAEDLFLMMLFGSEAGPTCMPSVSVPDGGTVLYLRSGPRRRSIGPFYPYPQVPLGWRIP